MKTVRLAFLALAAAIPGPAEVFDHSLWDGVLKAHVNAIGEVDYAALQADRKDLDEYIRRLGEASPESSPEQFPSREHELAYWLNAYNAFTIRGVVGNYPVASIRKLGMLWGFFREKDNTAGGKVLSLDDVEHEIIRKRYSKPRIHFALVCAAVSCPRLSRDAFRAENLEEHLDRLAREFVNEKRNVVVDTESNRITLSKIFDWFQSDFESAALAKGKRGVIEFVLRHAGADQRQALESLKNPKVKYHPYDWGLNDTGSRAKAKNPLERELAQSTG